MTNVFKLFDNLVELGQHPKEKADTVTVMEKIGHFLDSEVQKVYKKLKKDGYSKKDASPHIANKINVAKILKKSSKDWDGGYAMAGLMGHGDSFVLRDPAGIRPVYYYMDDEVVVTASDRPVIQTAFNVDFDDVKELEPGHALITKKSGETSIKKIIDPLPRKACSLSVFIFREEAMLKFTRRKNLGRFIMPDVLKAIDYDTINSFFLLYQTLLKLLWNG